MLAQALQFLVHFIDLLSILLRGNGFAGIQKAVVDQMGNRTPVTITFFFWSNLALGSALELLLSPATELVITGHVKSTFPCTSQSNREMVHCCVE